MATARALNNSAIARSDRERRKREERRTEENKKEIDRKNTKHIKQLKLKTTNSGVLVKYILGH